jgi:hypothetical protein
MTDKLRIVNDNEQLEPDFIEAARFLDALGGGEGGEFTFQTFQDNKSHKKNNALSKILHGSLDDHFEELSRLNQQGAGIFIMINKGDGLGRKAKNVIAVRAVFVDLDGSPLAPILEVKTKPHIITESSPGRYHAYWLVRDLPLKEFSKVQVALAEKFNGDKSVSDLPRVMRLPGFYWQKNSEPFLTKGVSA